MTTSTPNPPERSNSTKVALGIPKFSSDVVHRVSSFYFKEHNKVPVTIGAALNAFGGLDMVEKWLRSNKANAIDESQVNAWAAMVLGSHKTDLGDTPTPSAPASLAGLVRQLEPSVQSNVMAPIIVALSNLSASDLQTDPYRGAYQDLDGSARIDAMRVQVLVIVQELLALAPELLHARLLAASPASTEPNNQSLKPNLVLAAARRNSFAVIPHILSALNLYASAVLGKQNRSPLNSDTFFPELKINLAIAAQKLATR